eukprot:Gregarina_sp_Pseudo_9__5841@NODE_8_length_7001_cov_28_146941_g6_i0_p2_GENE_NODE_8_length_7001_cov_28_146941_g6_i0NODE_8_length_7001_cov_28_146941_g6_i0_p2_ORF_typecomplete_len644_score211_85N2227/PF07942_12/3_9e91_NODE_8_length_7001_cov_28_146941_g6_i038565787
MDGPGPPPQNNNSEHPALHPQFQALYRQLLLSLNQHGWRDGAHDPLAQKRASGPPVLQPSPLQPPFAETARRDTENTHPTHHTPPHLDLQQTLQMALAHKQRAEALPITHPAAHTRFPPAPFAQQPFAAQPPFTQQQQQQPFTHLTQQQQQQPTHPPSHRAAVLQPSLYAPPAQVWPGFGETAKETETQPPVGWSRETETQSREEETETESRLGSASQRAESAHFREVCRAFVSYECMAAMEVSRMERHFNSLSAREQSLLMEGVPQRIQKIKDAVATNQRFLNLLISQDLDLVDDELPSGGKGARRPSTEGHTLQGLLAEFNKTQSLRGEDSCSSECQDPIEPGCAIEDCDVSSMNMYKVRSTLKQFAREWSAERAAERDVAFKPLLKALDDYLPLEAFKQKEGRVPWVLCPGSGLGRLPFEVVSKGYSCQGNEFSYFMLLGSNFILNHALEPASINLVPFCLNSCNRREHEDHLQVISIPDVCAADGVAANVDFSMCAGDFVEVYMPQKGVWDAVLTCFFIDTAKNVICYIHTIANVIPPNGVWANMGPLLYHFADSITEMSVELSWEEIRQMVTRYFDIKEERWIDAFYTTPPRSMLQALYHCIFFVAIRNDVPVPAEFLQKQETPSPHASPKQQETGDN